MDNAGRLADVMRRPGMYGIATVEHAMMFVGGFRRRDGAPGKFFPPVRASWFVTGEGLSQPHPGPAA